MNDPVELVSPYRLEPPLAPSIAAQISGVDIEVHKIDHAYRELCKWHQFTLLSQLSVTTVPLFQYCNIPTLPRLNGALWSVRVNFIS